MKDKVALVTGAAGGIGGAVCGALGPEYKLCMVSRSIPPQNTDDVLALPCDVTKVDQVTQAVAAAVKKFGRINVLVNCAGLSHLGRVAETAPDTMRQVYETNVMGTVHMCQAVLPVMLKQKSGYIINLGSLRGVQYGVGKSAYAMSKSAVIAFSRVLAGETQKTGVRVTVINPGFVRTELIKHRIAEENLQNEDLTQPEDIAKSVLYLLSLSPGAVVPELNIGRLWGLE